MICRGSLGAAFGALCLLFAATPASADWLRAESERFIVYSEGSERDLRDYVRKLEMFDRVMRFRSNLPISETPPRKLPIYLVNNQGDLRQVRTTASRHTAGIYFPTEEDIFAVAIRRSAGGLDGEDVILHEYAHHFMLGMPGAYPAWFVEGFAEYYMTADIRDQEVILGGFNSNRAAWIMNATWLPLETLLRSHYSEVRQGSQQNTYYPIAWLLTHWLLNNDERRGQLAAYLEAVSEGGDPVTSMTDATGLSLQQLQSALRRYTRERLTQTNHLRKLSRSSGRGRQTASLGR